MATVFTRNEIGSVEFVCAECNKSNKYLPPTQEDYIIIPPINTIKVFIPLCWHCGAPAVMLYKGILRADLYVHTRPMGSEREIVVSSD